LFFFSSRRRHTRSYGDWSSDVCSSDLAGTWCRLVPITVQGVVSTKRHHVPARQQMGQTTLHHPPRIKVVGVEKRRQRDAEHFRRSEERRVGKREDLDGGRVVEKDKSKQ